MQSLWFSVGSVVVGGLAGVGAIARQASADLTFTHCGLLILRDGMTAAGASSALRESDQAIRNRKFAIVDATGGTVTFTGSACMGETGQYSGDGFTCQVNKMRNLADDGDDLAARGDFTAAAGSHAAADEIAPDKR